MSSKPTLDDIFTFYGTELVAALFAFALIGTFPTAAPYAFGLLLGCLIGDWLVKRRESLQPEASEQDSTEWHVALNDMVGGWGVSTSPKPFSQIVDYTKDCVVADCCYTEREAQAIAEALNAAGWTAEDSRAARKAAREAAQKAAQEAE